MTQKDRKLLLTDLCARLPYGVKFKADDEEYIREIHYIKDEDVYIREYRNLSYWIDTIKPYLRSLSSMTEEEKTELFQLMGNGTDVQRIDFYLSHYFDYRGLIEKGLALEAPKGMYNLNKK